MTQRSDTRFTIGVVAVALLVAGLGVYFLGRGGTDSPVADASARNGAGQRPSGPAASGPTRAAAIAVVRRNTILSVQGRYAAACALESPAYLKFDARHYAQGSCAAAEEAVMTAVKARGVALRFRSTRVVSFGHGRATVLGTVSAGGKAVATHAFVQYHHGRWWITGGDDSGDLGY